MYELNTTIYKNTIQMLEDSPELADELFKSSNINEILQKYTLRHVYDTLQEEVLKQLRPGAFVGLELNMDTFESGKPCYDDVVLEFLEDADIPKYGYIMNYLPKENAYNVITALGSPGEDSICLLKVKKHNIRVLFTECAGEMRYDLSKFMVKQLDSFREDAYYLSEVENGK